MIKTMILMMSAASMLTGKPDVPIPEQSSHMEIIVEQSVDNPKTGEHPAPIWAGMILAFSGVAIGLMIDDKGKKD